MPINKSEVQLFVVSSVANSVADSEPLLHVALLTIEAAARSPALGSGRDVKRLRAVKITHTYYGVVTLGCACVVGGLRNEWAAKWLKTSGGVQITRPLSAPALAALRRYEEAGQKLLLALLVRLRLRGPRVA